MTSSLTIHDAAAQTGPLRAWKRWLSLQAYGAVTSTFFRARTSPYTMRARFERFAIVSRSALQRKRPGLTFEDHEVGSLAMESVRAVENPALALIHLHGGGYFMGSPASYRNRAMRLSFRCNAEVFVPDYRLAPEHRFPAPLEDAVAAIRYVRTKRPEMPIFVTGDSAGGGLALSLLVKLRELDEPMPKGAILLSPWADMTSSGASYASNAKRDLWLSQEHLEVWGRYTLGDARADDPAVSPVFADLSGLPPMLVIVGGAEVLLDDATRIVESARAHGTEAHLFVGQGMQHDFPLTLPWLDESREAWSQIVHFVDDPRP